MIIQQSIYYYKKQIIINYYYLDKTYYLIETNKLITKIKFNLII